MELVMPYRAFISYSHAADGKLAPALQSALHRFAKPWYRLRAIHVFRDGTSLSVTPALWPTIEKALGDSELFILMASPEAAASHWVRQEVDYWLKHKTADKILIVLTEGEIVWDDAAGDFDWGQTTALPETLKKTFAQVPHYLDLRWAKQEEHLSLKQPNFLDAVAELAATLHGKPKDEITGEDVFQHRRTRKILWAALVTLLTLTVASVVAFLIAFHQYHLADERGKIALSRQLAAQAEKLKALDFDVSLLLSIEAFEVANTPEANRALFTTLYDHPKIRAILEGHHGTVTSIALSPDGKIIATGSADKTIRLFDLAKRQQLSQPLLGHTDRVESLTFSPDGRFLISGSSDHTIMVWAPESQKLIAKMIGHQAPLLNVAISPDGKTLASASWDKTIRLWDLATGQLRGAPLAGHTDQVFSLTFSHDGKILMSASGDRTIIMWEIDKSKIVRRLKGLQEGVYKVAFNPDHTLLASVGLNNNIMLWNSMTLQQVGSPLEKYNQVVTSMAFNPDGKTLSIGRGDGTVSLFDTKNFIPLGPPLKGHNDKVSSVAFTPDGHTLVSASTNETIIWEVSVYSLLNIARQLCKRNLTGEEWHRYIGNLPYHKTCRNLPEAEEGEKAKLYWDP
jgi:DNA-binding beta-propeller fold protein YncE